MGRLTTQSEEETRALGRRIAQHLGPGDFVGLSGPLGAGKTRLAQGLCEGLGVDPRAVVSPTFALVNTYEGRCPVFHVDLYRIDTEEELEATGILDVLHEGVAIVEWIDRVPSLAPPGALLVDIEDCGENTRELSISGPLANEI